jgi:excisionase family DNA binding protein
MRKILSYTVPLAVTEVDMSEYISTKEAAAIMGITESLVRRWAREGKIAGKRFGRDWQIEKAAANAYKPTRTRKATP